jgi:hypothetical protein
MEVGILQTTHTPTSVQRYSNSLRSIIIHLLQSRIQIQIRLSLTAIDFSKIPGNQTKTATPIKDQIKSGQAILPQAHMNSTAISLTATLVENNRMYRSSLLMLMGTAVIIIQILKSKNNQRKKWTKKERMINTVSMRKRGSQKKSLVTRKRSVHYVARTRKMTKVAAARINLKVTLSTMIRAKTLGPMANLM